MTVQNNRANIYFWLIPKLFMMFLLLNVLFILYSYFNYVNNRYYQVVYSLTNAVLTVHDKYRFNQNRSTYPSTWPAEINYSVSDIALFKNKLTLNIEQLYQTYHIQSYREVRKRLQEALPKRIYGRQQLSVCYVDTGKCVNFDIQSTNKIYLYLLILIASLFTAFFLPIYFAYTRRLLKPFLKMQQVAQKLGIVTRKHAIFMPLFMQNAADLMLEVSDKVELMLEEKIQTLAALSHDLKTPLAKSKLYLQNVIPENYHQPLLKYFSDLEYLINQMNMYSAKAHKTEKFQRVELVDFIESICHEYHINSACVTFSASADKIFVSLQRQAFKRVVQNIIDNGLKYAGSIDVLIVTPVDKQEVIIRFLDEGSGVDENLIHKLCDPFFRVDQARNHSISGFGLGLAIVKDIMAQNHGQLHIYNRSDQRGLGIDISFAR